MTRSVSVTEAKAKWGDLLKWVVEKGDDVIIESRGDPQVVLVAFKEYEELQQLRKEVRRAGAIANSAGQVLSLTIPPTND